MEAIATLIVILIGLVGFDVAANLWGEDSRERTSDDFAGWPIH
jgi:uncharacterized membrane protein YuzA (DUF378 family)